MPPQPQPSIKDLVAKTAADAQRLAAAQAALFKTELSATGGKLGLGGAMGVATAAIAGFATLFLLLTVAFVLVALGLPVWAGMLIVAVLLLIAGTITAFIAKNSFESVKGPDVAIAELERTKAALSGASADVPPITPASVTAEVPETRAT